MIRAEVTYEASYTIQQNVTYIHTYVCSCVHEHKTNASQSIFQNDPKPDQMPPLLPRRRFWIFLGKSALMHLGASCALTSPLRHRRYPLVLGPDHALL